MDKYTYLHQLYQSLSSLSEHERSTIMHCAEEKFTLAAQDGRPISAVIDELNLLYHPDAPPLKHRIYKRPEPTKKEKNTSSWATLIFIILIALSLFCLTGPFLAGWGILFALLIGGIAIFVSGIALMLTPALPHTFVYFLSSTNIHSFLIFFSGILLIGLGTLLSALSIYGTKFYIRFIKYYFKLLKNF